MNADVQRVIDAVRTEVGDSLRVVGVYDRDGYDIRYVRDDVRPKLTDELVQRIHEDLVLRGLGTAHLENLFDAGELRCTIHQFSEATVFHYSGDDFTGLAVSVDSDADLRLDTFEDICDGGP